MIYQYRNALDSTVLSSFENWKAFIEKAESKYAYEIPLYSDATLGFFDQLRAGPYQFFRTVPSNACEKPFRTIMVMRVDAHITKDDLAWLADLEKTDDAAYHGGDLNDEIAALLSLLLGVRLMPGTETRQFNSRFDPLGIPGDSSVIPTLGISSAQTIIPRLQRREGVRTLPGLFETYPILEKTDALMLVKAARQYQQAIWYADTDQNLAWLMLVSAVETAANHWRNERVASKKFIEFVSHFLPGPPESRPSAMGRFPFEEKTKLEEALRKIYNYRSKALHEGKPFPAPMCHSPGRYGGDDEIAEIPTGLATGALGSTWRHEDTPMALHTFEHIVRSSLTEWWRSMVGRRGR